MLTTPCRKYRYRREQRRHRDIRRSLAPHPLFPAYCRRTSLPLPLFFRGVCVCVPVLWLLVVVYFLFPTGFCFPSLPVPVELPAGVVGNHPVSGLALSGGQAHGGGGAFFVHETSRGGAGDPHLRQGRRHLHICPEVLACVRCVEATIQQSCAVCRVLTKRATRKALSRLRSSICQRVCKPRYGFTSVV